MRFSVLGPLAVHAGGRDVTPAGARLRLLLALLLDAAPRVAFTDALADALWPRGEASHPAAALQTLVSRLRALLRDGGDAGDAVEHHPHGYRLVIEASALDVAAFEALVDASARAGDAASALACLDEALALWRGAPYEEFADVRALEPSVRRLRELRAAALERRAALLLALGRVADALVVAQGLVLDDPLRERPRALLMEAAYRAGRAGEALATFQEYRRLLAEELGLAPSPALRQLELEVIRHERMLGATDVAPTTTELVEAPAAPALRATFVARAHGRLAWARAGTGMPLLVPPAWLGHLGAMGAGLDPRAPLLAMLAARHELLLYDWRGMGLSGGTADFTVDESVDDAIAVLDAAGVERAAVLGISQGGPTALALAARHPGRVSRLVLMGTFASGPRTFTRAEVRASVLALVRAHWGMGSRALASLIVPGSTVAETEAYARLQRESATPEAAARALERVYTTDVSAEVPSVAHEALVLHYLDDPAVPFHAAQELAAALARGRLLPLPGRSHVPRGFDLSRVAGLVRAFLAAEGNVASPPPALARARGDRAPTAR